MNESSDLCFCAIVVIRHLGRLLLICLAVLLLRKLQPGFVAAGGADLGQVVALLDALPPEHVVQASHQQYTGEDAAKNSAISIVRGIQIQTQDGFFFRTSTVPS